jgi:hypothetical protein
MTVLRRTIFRQAGGPAEMPMGPPPQMAQQAPPPDLEGQINAVEQQAAEGGEQAGLEYLAGTMEGIDAAQSFEEVINAMRGNDAPMQERRMELAEYVGDDDAYRTPDSVLAMVQPTILLTEEGAMDSGIGQLMQALSADVEMMGPEGEAAPVGQGVGELLVQGQPAPPPMPQEMMAAGGPVIKKFAAGGAVQKFSNGMGVNANPMAGTGLERLYDMNPGMFKSVQGELDPQQLDALYPERLALYKEIYGDDDDERQRGFDLAQAGFALASGVDPSTGQNIAGRPFLSQMGSALTPLAQRQSERLSDQRKGERALRLAAMQSAEAEGRRQKDEVSAERQAIFGAMAQSGAQERGVEADRAKYEYVSGQQMERLQTSITADMNQLMKRIASAEGMQTQRLDDTARQNWLDRSHDTDLTKLRASLTKDRDNLLFDLGERSAMLDNNRRIEMSNKLFEQTKDLRTIDQRNALQRMQQTLLNTKELRGPLSEQAFRVKFTEIERALDKERRVLDTEQAERLSEFRYNLLDAEREDQFELQEEYLDLAKDKYDLSQDQFDFTKEKYGDLSTAQEVESEINRRMKETQINAINSGIAEEKLQFRTNLYLTEREQQLNYKLGIEKIVSQNMRALAELANQPLFKNDETSYLNNPNNIRDYAAGKYVPGYEGLLLKNYGQIYDQGLGTYRQVSLPSEFRSALRSRRRLNVTGPYDDFGIEGFAEGGGVGMRREPFTGELMIDEESTTPFEETIATPEPYITGLKGVDVTAGTGTDSFLLDKFNTIVGVLDDLTPGEIGVPAKQTSKAVPAINALNQMTLITGLESIAGRQNVQLQERLATLNVEAASFFQNDAAALEQFRTFDRVLDSTIDVQESIMEGGGLSKKDRNKARVELRNLKSLKSEYENLITRYERSLGEGEMSIDEELEQFFK